MALGPRYVLGSFEPIDLLLGVGVHTTMLAIYREISEEHCC